MHHGSKECRKLLDDDETSKTIGHTGLTTSRRRKATDHPTWEAQVYVISFVAVMRSPCSSSSRFRSPFGPFRT